MRDTNHSADETDSIFPNTYADKDERERSAPERDPCELVDALEVADGQVLASASAGDASVCVAAPADAPPPIEALRTALCAVADVARARSLSNRRRADADADAPTRAGGHFRTARRERDRAVSSVGPGRREREPADTDALTDGGADPEANAYVVDCPRCPADAGDACFRSSGLDGSGADPRPLPHFERMQSARDRGAGQ